MGFFGDIWNGIKSVGKSIGTGIRTVGKAVSSIGRPIHRAISKGYNFAKSLPVIGGIVKNSPVGGAIEKGLDLGGKALDVADKAGQGDYLGAGRAIYNATRG